MPEREQYNNPDNDQGVGRTSFRLIDRFRSAGLRAALPLSAILLTVTAACAKGESDKPNEVMGSEKFTDDLPMTLREVCKLYVSSANLGPDVRQVEKRLGHNKIRPFFV